QLGAKWEQTAILPGSFMLSELRTKPFRNRPRFRRAATGALARRQETSSRSPQRKQGPLPCLRCGLRQTVTGSGTSHHSSPAAATGSSGKDRRRRQRPHHPTEVPARLSHSRLGSDATTWRPFRETEVPARFKRRNSSNPPSRSTPSSLTRLSATSRWTRFGRA